MKICWIGTGVMGASMVKNCMQLNIEANVYNRTFKRQKPVKHLVQKHSKISRMLWSAVMSSLQL